MLLGHVLKVKKLMAIVCLFGLCLGQGYSFDSDDKDKLTNTANQRYLLIVDDQEEILKKQTQYFESKNCKVKIAHNETEAWEMINNPAENIYWILTDVDMLNQGDGINLAKRTLEKFGRTKYICLNSANESYKKDADALDVEFFEKKDVQSLRKFRTRVMENS